jgi:hypothetical protein
MAKAHLTTKSGTTIVIEGTPEEVATLMKQLDGDPLPSDSVAKVKKRVSAGEEKPKADKPTPVNLISSLIDGGFFKKPKDLGAVKTALEEMGHYYPVTSLSPALLRLVRKRQLRRLKDQKRWLYTG